MVTKRDNLQSIKVGPHGRIVIPNRMRKHLGVEIGDELIARIEGEHVILEKRETVLKRVQERFSRVATERSLADELIAERRAEAAREDEA